MNPDISPLLRYKTLFISGIDTDAGKTYATAWLAKKIIKKGESVITQKFIQTGCTGSSEDIEAHRRLMGIEMLPDDLDGTTAPIIFSYPASAQLAAEIDGLSIDLSLVDKSLSKLGAKYDHILLEGAGGLMVPVADDYFTIDYVSERNLPVVLVTNGILGSINHTILSLEALEKRGIEVAAVIYNAYFDNPGRPEINKDTRRFIDAYLKRRHQSALFLEMPRF